MGRAPPAAPLTEAGCPGYPRLRPAAPPQELPALLVAAIFHVIGLSTGAPATPASLCLCSRRKEPWHSGVFGDNWAEPARECEGGTPEEDLGDEVCGESLRSGSEKRESRN